MYHVYVLQSLTDGRTYVGYTNDVERRLAEHNAGKSKATKHRRPFKILFVEEYKTMKEAKDKEIWWKSSSGRKKLKAYFSMLMDTNS